MVQVHSSPGNGSAGWRHTYVAAFRHRDMVGRKRAECILSAPQVSYERDRGFRHSYRDKEALERLGQTKQWEAGVAVL